MRLDRFGFVWSVSLLAMFGLSGARASDVRLDTIIQNVEANEQLYRDLEVRAQTTLELVNNPDENPALLQSLSDNTRFVSQHGMVYFNTDRHGRSAGGQKVNEDAVEGWDGHTMRVLEQNQVGNIRDDLVLDGRWFVPHCMILKDGPGPELPLSSYLRGGKATRAVPWFKDATISVSYEGDELREGLNCHRIRVEYRLDSWPPEHSSDVRLIWLAPERNYLPVRTEGWPGNPHPAKPGVFDTPTTAGAEQGWVSDLRELAPGVWLPFHVTRLIHDRGAWAREGKLLVVNHWETQVKEASLDPNYDISLFQDVPFPDGAQVLEIRGGKTVRTYTQGERKEGQAHLSGVCHSALRGCY